MSAAAQAAAENTDPTFGTALALLVIADGIKSASVVRLVKSGFADFDLPPEHKAVILRAVDCHVDMLVALQRCERDLVHLLADDARNDPTLEIVRAAVARATGSAP